jgi:hypothetical protein
MLSLSPSPGLLHGPPDVRGSLGRAGIAGEVVVFKGTFNPVLAHAIGIRGDTERYISRGGPVLVLDRRSESLEGEIRERGVQGRERACYETRRSLLCGAMRSCLQAGRPAYSTWR